MLDRRKHLIKDGKAVCVALALGRRCHDADPAELESFLDGFREVAGVGEEEKFALRVGPCPECGTD